LQFISVYIDQEKLSCYNRKRKKCVGMTDLLWASMILSASAFNGRLMHMGIPTIVDLRRFFEKPLTWENCLNYSWIVVKASQSGIRTIGELCASVWKDFKAKVKEKDYLRWLKIFMVSEGRKDIATPLGLSPHLTNIGSWKIQRPFVANLPEISGDDTLLYNDLTVQSTTIIGENVTRVCS
jgi:hypothetical protein